MTSRFRLAIVFWIGIVFCWTGWTGLEPREKAASHPATPMPDEGSQVGAPVLPGIRIHPDEGFVDIDARMCSGKGMLELVACTKGSKEHESIVAIETKALHVHTALLLLNAEAGAPAQRKQAENNASLWTEVPPTGTPVDVSLVYDGGHGGRKTETPINQCMKQENGAPFATHTFLFAGSALYRGNQTEETQYLADRSGNVISIATFGDETLCLPGIHSHLNQELNWSVAGEALPQAGAQVILRLRPHAHRKQTTHPVSTASNAPGKKQVTQAPTRVFILAGQSNMEGQGVVSMNHPERYNGGRGNLEWSMKHSESAGKMKHLKDSDGNWIVREDVRISFKSRKEHRKGNLTVGYTSYGGSSHIGPELQFGHVMGDYYEEPVLLIKTAWGGKSLHADFRPPSSGGQVGRFYELMIEDIHEALAEMKHDPHELSGFVWMQGWNDMVNKNAIPEYADHLVHLAQDIRNEFKAPELPFIVGELGNGGPVRGDGNMADFRNAQREGTARIPNARFVETAEFARPKERSPNITHGHHWFGNAESYFLIGDALARATIQMIETTHFHGSLDDDLDTLD